MLQVMRALKLSKFALSLMLIIASLAYAQNTISAQKANRECYVSNYKANSVLVFDAAGTGNLEPLREITGLNRPTGIALDSQNGELYIANSEGNSIAVYSRNANGNEPPRRTIQGVKTALNHPEGIALNVSENEIYVANFRDNSVTVYPRTAQGDASPIRTIKGKDTQLIGPWRIAYSTKRKEIIVVNSDIGPQQYNVVVFDRTANGNVKPIKILATSEFSTQAKGIAIDAERGKVLILYRYVEMPDYGESYVDVYSSTADGYIGPSKTLVLPNEDLDDITLDSINNELYFTDRLPNTITIYKVGQPSRSAPIRKIAGPATRLSHPQGIVIYNK